LAEVVSVRFPESSKPYFFSPAGLAIRAGDYLVVENKEGLAFTKCLHGNMEVPDSEVVAPLKNVIRIATRADKLRWKSLAEINEQSLAKCRKAAADLKLDMKLISSETAFDGKKVTFYFFSEQHVDFRELVKTLASELHARIEMRQVGVRDETKIIGGIGRCGREFCCKSYMKKFSQVSVKMAKNQGISPNPAKISGACGKLMCCIKYENDVYEELQKESPPANAFVSTKDGKGVISGINLISKTVKVRLADENDVQIKSFPFDEIEVIGNKQDFETYRNDKAQLAADKRDLLKSRAETKSAAAPRILADLPPVNAAPADRPAQPAADAPRRDKNKRRRNKNRDKSAVGVEPAAAPRRAENASPSAAQSQPKPEGQQSRPDRQQPAPDGQRTSPRNKRHKNRARPSGENPAPTAARNGTAAPQKSAPAQPPRGDTRRGGAPRPTPVERKPSGDDL
jgi:cell fate regulator YaaT (PSP1 superfamily)